MDYTTTVDRAARDCYTGDVALLAADHGHLRGRLCSLRSADGDL
jgi:hypothetical protein